MSVGGSPGFGCSPGSNEAKICDCLGCSLETIATATEGIYHVLDERLGKICEHIDECIDEIIDAINSRYGPGLATIQECQGMLQRGLGGTLEYALKCASRTADECDAICSIGDPTTDGQCCNYCGESPCVCSKGECIPKDEKEKEKQPYVGWCNPVSKVVAVTKQGEGPPFAGMIQVSVSDTEQTAFAEAESYCKSIKLTPPPQQIPPIPSGIAYPTPFCTQNAYRGTHALQQIAQQAPGTKLISGYSTVLQRARAIGFEGLNLGTLSDIWRGIAEWSFGTPALVADEFIPALSGLVNCDNASFQESMKVLAAAGLARNASGIDISEFLTPYVYAMHAACRQKLLDPDKAIAAYLSDSTGKFDIDTHWAVNGLCNESLNFYLQAARSKPVPLQLAIMRRREIISQSEYHNRMREIGFLDGEAREQLFKITEQVPTLTDIIRFMVRDAGDDKPGGVVDRFKLDTQFETKYSEQLKQWSRDQGIPDSVAQYAWRAHWSIPSPGQLFEFYHRLRKIERFNQPRPLLDEIKAALIQQDILPFWHDHYLAVSFHPMRLRDIRRSFQVGTLTEEQAADAFTQLGYSDDTVKLMVKFLVRLRDQAVTNHRVIKQWYRFQISRQQATEILKGEGLPDDVINRAFTLTGPNFSSSEPAKAYVRGELTRNQFSDMLDTAGVPAATSAAIITQLSLRKRNHPALKDYDAGLIDDNTAVNQMVADGFVTDIARNRINAVGRDIERDFVIACQRGIKRRYLLGEIDKKHALAELNNRGTVHQRAAKMVEWWDCELKSGEKHVSANTLCEWLARGAITAKDFTDRLEKIGFSENDAALMLEDCLIKVSARRLAQAKKEAKEQAAEQARIQRILARQAREVERLQRQQEAAATKARQTRVNREKQIYSAVDKITDKCDCELAATIEMVKGRVQAIKEQYLLHIDEALQAALLAAEEFPQGGVLDEYAAIIDTIASGITKANLNGETICVTLPPTKDK